MLAVFADPLPEEPLYSVAARYGEMMAVSALSVLKKAVFGAPGVEPAVELPVRIDALIERLPPGAAYTADELMARHTGLPYYGAFVSADRLAKAVDVMRKGASGARGSISSLLGVGPALVRPPLYLRYCRRCVVADRSSQQGTPYWRRVHQIAGVVVCPDHEVPLTESVVARHRRGEVPRYVSLRQALESAKPRDDLLVAPSVQPFAHGIAVDALWLLQHRARLGDTGVRRVDLTPWFAAAGWLGAAGQAVRWDRVRDAAAQVADDILAALGCTLPDGVDSLALLTRTRQSIPPLFNLVLLRLAGFDAQRFFTTVAPDAPARRVHANKVSPLEGPCANPFCSAYSASALGKFAATAVRTVAGAYVVACPVCGYSYRELPTGARGRRRRTIATGELWDQRFIKLLSEGAGPAEIRRTLGPMVDTIIQEHARRLGVWRSSWGDAAFARAGAKQQKAERRAAEALAIRDALRQSWLALQETHPDAGRQALAAYDRRLYARLTRHDRAWLIEHAPPALSPQPPSRRQFDWPARDAELYDAVAGAVAALRERTTGLEQVTVQRIARSLGGRAKLKHSPERIPQTTALLAKVVESPQDFAVRRIAAAARQFAEERVVPTRTALCIRACTKGPGRTALQPAVIAAVDLVRSAVAQGASLVGVYDIARLLATRLGGYPAPDHRIQTR